ncbi:helix-turn-helix domain-containing protein [Paracoccaceae bacterium GXU_MW_L88]
MERSNNQLVSAFAKVLKRRRKAKSFSQEELAFRANISVSYVSLLETSNRQPTLSVIAALCEQLDVSMPEFLADVEQEMGR